MASLTPRSKLRLKRSVPEATKGRKGINNAFNGKTTKLSNHEMTMHGKDVNREECKVCGKAIYFTSCMTRSDYTYKTSKGRGKIKYACGYNHYLQLKGR